MFSKWRVLISGSSRARLGSSRDARSHRVMALADSTPKAYNKINQEFFSFKPCIIHRKLERVSVSKDLGVGAQKQKSEGNQCFVKHEINQYIIKKTPLEKVTNLTTVVLFVCGSPTAQTAWGSTISSASDGGVESDQHLFQFCHFQFIIINLLILLLNILFHFFFLCINP